MDSNNPLISVEDDVPRKTNHNDNYGLRLKNLSTS